MKSVLNSKCHVCKLGDWDYSDELNCLPDDKALYQDEIKNRKKEILSLKQELKELDEKVGVNMKCPDNFNEKIWKKVRYAPDIIKEIEKAKIENFENKIKIEDMNEQIKNNQDDLDQIQKKLDIDNNTKSNYDEIRRQIKNLEYEDFQEIKSSMLELTNKYFIELTSPKAGKILFDIKGELVLQKKLSLNDEKTKTKTITKKFCSQNNVTSPGILKRISLAFAFSFLSYQIKYKIRPLNIIIIDGLALLDLESIELIYEGFANDNFDYKILIFHTEDVPKKYHRYVQTNVSLLRNPNIVSNSYEKQYTIKDLIKDF